MKFAVNSSAGYKAFEFTTTANGGHFQVMNLMAPNLSNASIVGLTIGKSRSTSESIHLYYKDHGMGGLCMFWKGDIITFTNNSIALNATTTVSGNLTVTGTITGKQSNTTITHYSPI